ncbi:replication protein A 70 kDa DNA-binding subunit-like [Glossina fuscipes]|uniref:Replication protein A 70 kDa DNA-binding subunit n=1 Tax=Glossina fuscipes TaxID=7396 RepID=A0A9C5ZCR7_9MUSC|nr:replication protein A 70 kDa DNA-binding subunit-like [Glossina fuscipes]
MGALAKKKITYSIATKLDFFSHHNSISLWTVFPFFIIYAIYPANLFGLQILGVKKIITAESERIRILISDGQYFNSYAMPSIHLNFLCEEEQLKENTIIRVGKYITSIVSKNDAGKRVVIVMGLTVLHPDAPASSAQTAAPSLTSLLSTSNKKSKPAKENRSFSNGNSKNTNLDQSMNDGLTSPIASLSPYHNKWVIKARVTAKSVIRSWSNARGEGKLFSMDLMDESGEIRATAFREQCDKFYDIIQVDQVYLKPANKQFATLKKSVSHHAQPFSCAVAAT